MQKNSYAGCLGLSPVIAIHTAMQERLSSPVKHDTDIYSAL